MFVDYAISNNLTPFISMQNHYNLIYREEEREMLPALKASRPVSPHTRSMETDNNDLSTSTSGPFLGQRMPVDCLLGPCPNLLLAEK
jgi:hypothetical protein